MAVTGPGKIYFELFMEEDQMKKTVKDIDVKGKRVFVRCDFNVPDRRQRRYNR